MVSGRPVDQTFYDVTVNRVHTLISVNFPTEWKIVHVNGEMNFGPLRKTKRI